MEETKPLPTTSAVERLGELLREAGVTVRFGLRQQGHFDRVTEMRAAGASWDDIGRAISWNGQAVEKCYAIEAAPGEGRCYCWLDSRGIMMPCAEHAPGEGETR